MTPSQHVGSTADEPQWDSQRVRPAACPPVPSNGAPVTGGNGEAIAKGSSLCAERGGAPGPSRGSAGVPRVPAVLELGSTVSRHDPGAPWGARPKFGRSCGISAAAAGARCWAEQGLCCWELVGAWLTPLPWLGNTFALQSLRGIHTPSKRNTSGLSAQALLWLFPIHFASLHAGSSCLTIVLIETVLVSSEAAYTKICLNPMVIRRSHRRTDFRVLATLFLN